MSDDNNIHERNSGRSPDSMTSDEGDAQLDALLARFGGDYNTPPDIVPREEMWHQIRASTELRHASRGKPVWRILAAAGVLLGVGIGIGAEVHSRIGPHASSLPAVAEQRASDGTRHAVATLPASGDSIIDTGTVPTARTAQSSVARSGIVATRGSLASSTTAAGTTVGVNPNARAQAYTLATVRHFTAVEALLTSYQTESHDAHGDAEMASWARALLSQTRLLLDSPAATDPARRKLLQDLELVLVQMTQLSPANTPIDREMIDGSVRHSDVITRLRTAVPAGGATQLQ